MHVIGLTGGIASGKSSVARRLVARGVPVVDADQVAREVVEPGRPALSALVERFGASILDASGRLDRPALARLVFDDAEKRAALNAILHPHIAARSQQLLAEAAAQGHRLAVYEAALLVENGIADAFRPLIVVAAPRAVQKARLIERDGVDERAAEARLAAQASMQDKIAAADHVIHNDGDLDDLQARADAVLDTITSSLQLEPF